MGTNQFGFTEDQEMFRQTIRRFAKKELAPTAWAREAPDCPAEIKDPVMKKVMDQGWLRVNYPEKFDGLPLSWVELGILTEELEKVDLTMGIWPWFSAFNAANLQLATQEVQDELFPRLATLAAFIGRAYTEADSGNDFTTIKTKAVRHGDHYIVNGEKQPASMVMFSSHMIFSCKTNTNVPGHEGMSMFVIPKNLPGIKLSSIPYCLGALGMSRKDPRLGGGNAIVSFDDCKVPAKYLLGEEGSGYKQQEDSYNIARLYGITICTIAWAEAAVEWVINYAKERKHFGRPILQFEGVSFQIAENHVNLEAARMLTYQAMWLKDQGRPNVKETAMAKLFGIWAGQKALHEMVVIGGYNCFTLEHWMQDRLRNAIGMEITDGAEHIQKLHILRELIGPEALPTGMSDKF